jgi:hypothetical protein
MKTGTLLLLALIALLLIGCRNDSGGLERTLAVNTAGTDKLVTAPEEVLSAFKSEYPQAVNISWTKINKAEPAPIDWEMTGWKELTSEDILARFKVGINRYWVWYMNTGSWIGTTSEVNDHSTIPFSVHNMIKAKFPGFAIGSIYKNVDKNTVEFQVELTKYGRKFLALFAGHGKMKRLKKIK